MEFRRSWLIYLLRVYDYMICTAYKALSTVAYPQMYYNTVAGLLDRVKPSILHAGSMTV